MKRKLLFLATCVVLVALGTVVVLTKEQHPIIALLTVVAMGALCWAWQIREDRHKNKTKKLSQSKRSTTSGMRCGGIG